MPLIYAGIDEAGYGPMFGPFVVARSVFQVDEIELAPEDDPPSLWGRMKAAVCKSISDKKRRIAVNDSKKLYTPAAGLSHLERGVLAFAALAGHEPGDLENYLACLGHDDHSRIPDLLWYTDPDDDTGPALPTAADDGQVRIACARLRRAAESARVAAADLAACVMYEDRYNQMCAATRSKGRTAWAIVSQHLDVIFRTHGHHHPRVVVDRQGGRSHYAGPLRTSFPELRIDVLDETVYRSRYRLTDPADGRSMTILFEINSEENHLPVALASMTAKYTRELLMERFNRFFCNHAPDLKPTKGYAQDGKRFLQDVAPLLTRLGIDEAAIVRQR